jgi:hypothetical protein
MAPAGAVMSIDNRCNFGMDVVVAHYAQKATSRIPASDPKPHPRSPQDISPNAIFLKHLRFFFGQGEWSGVIVDVGILPK